ncbi:MAG: hypothetical protein K6G16_07030 [Lachnospiraceae bacterium]|nr:hypothetical protein [Lachnospiraceae bacterium]
MNHEYRFGAHIGTSSLLLIFLTLSLISFGALSLAGARADERLSEKLLVHTQEYYAASHKAEAFIAQTDTRLRAALAESSGPSDYQARIDGLTSDLSVPMNDTQTLHVSLSFVSPSETDSAADTCLYQITRWRIENTDNASYERHLPVSGSGGLD